MSDTMETVAMPDDAFAQVGARLRAVREILEISQGAMAMALGVPKARIVEAETGETPPNAAMLIGIALHWPQISAEWLLAARGPMLCAPTAEASGDPPPTASGPSASQLAADKEADALRAGAHRVHMILKGLDIIIADKIGIGNQGTSPDDVEVIWELVSVAQAAAAEVAHAVG
jgi:transcriptional regulator with XRE-family HTH domain